MRIQYYISYVHIEGGRDRENKKGDAFVRSFE